MRIYSATLTRDVESTCTFESTDCQTGNKVGKYSVPLKLSKGERHFRTLKRCKQWAATLNSEFGEGAVVINGKV